MKLRERLLKYGAVAYAKMRGFTGKKALKEIERLKKLISYAPEELIPRAPQISRSQRSYWRDVKSLAKERDMGIKETRTLLKRLKTGRNVQVRVIKHGEGWQLILLGMYENTDKDSIYYKQKDEATGHSYSHDEQDYEECLEECVREAQAQLGGSGWMLVKILKETWIRYYGREI